MKHLMNYTIYTFGILLVFFSCTADPILSPEEGIDTERTCWSRIDSQIVFTQLAELEVTNPSKISLYFKLDDNTGQPVANLTAANFNIYEQSANTTCLQPISEFEAARKVSKEERKFSHNTLILLDLSGSVLNNFSVALKDATKALVEEINPNRDTNLNRIGIFWFDGASEIHQLIAPSLDKEAILASIEKIDTSVSQDNSTNLYGAISSMTAQANTMLEEQSNVTGVSILLFTDGKDRANRVSRQVAYDAIENSHQAISFFSVGLGTDINEEDLKKFGKDSFVGLQDVSQLITTFSAIAQSVQNESNSYYFFEYCSPIRAGAANTFILEAIVGDKKGFIENTFSADGFGGGCEL